MKRKIFHQSPGMQIKKKSHVILILTLVFLSDSSVSCYKESQIKESRDICLAKVIDSLIPLRTVKWGERVFSLTQHPSEWSLALFIQVIPQLPSPVSNSQHMQCLQG